MANEALLTEAARLLRAERDEDWELLRKDWMERYNRSRDPMVWAVQFPDATVKVEDLPLEVIDRIARTAGESWFYVVNTPMQDLTVSLEVLRAAALHVGSTVDLDGLTVRGAVDLFTLVPDDVPEPETPPDDDGPLAGRNGPATATAGSPG